MDISRLNIPLTLTLTESRQNSYGDPVRIITDGPRRLWAELKKQTVKEFINHDVTIANNSVTFAVRYTEGLRITTKHTLNFNNEDYDIVDINHDYTGRDYTLIKAIRKKR